jgi:hypothetical protein
MASWRGLKNGTPVVNGAPTAEVAASQIEDKVGVHTLDWNFNGDLTAATAEHGGARYEIRRTDPGKSKALSNLIAAGCPRELAEKTMGLVRKTMKPSSWDGKVHIRIERLSGGDYSAINESDGTDAAGHPFGSKAEARRWAESQGAVVKFLRFNKALDDFEEESKGVRGAYMVQERDSGFFVCDDKGQEVKGPFKTYAEAEAERAKMQRGA